MTYLSLAGVLLLVLLAVFVGRLGFAHERRWTTVGAGVAISYVFLDILPHLASLQDTLRDTLGTGISGFLEHHSYLVALAGFLLYIGLLRESGSAADPTSPASSASRNRATNVLIGALAVYYFLIGYLVGEQPAHRYEPVIIFAVAMGIHMLGVNHTVRDFDPRRYDRLFGYVLGAAIFAGWSLGVMTDVPDTLFALAFSFLVGAIIIVAFFIELQVVDSSADYWRLVAGAAAFSALLLIYERLANTNLAA